MALNDEQVRALLRSVSETHSDEIDCEQFLLVMAQYAEARAENRPVPEALAKAEAHERLCPYCREECRALTELVRAQHADRP